MNSGKEFKARPRSRDVPGVSERSNQLFKVNSTSNQAPSDQARPLNEKLRLTHQRNHLLLQKEAGQGTEQPKERVIPKNTDLFAAEPRAAGGPRQIFAHKGKFSEIFNAKQTSRSRLNSHEINEDSGGEGLPKDKLPDKQSSMQFLNPKMGSLGITKGTISSKTVKQSTTKVDILIGTVSGASMVPTPATGITMRTNPSEEAPVSPSAALRSGLIEQTLSIRVMSSWHPGSRTAGLHSIELRDRADNLIELESSCLSCRNCGMAAPKSLENLISPNRKTTSDWMCMFMDLQSGKYPEIILDLRKLPQVGRLKICNMLPKEGGGDQSFYSGVRKISVYLNNKEMFTGELKRATEKSQYQPFEIMEDLTTDIDLKSCQSYTGSPSMPRSDALSKNAQSATAMHPSRGIAKFVGVTSAGNLGLASITSASKVVGRATVNSIGSEEDDSKRDTLGKQSAAGHAPSIESREREDPILRGRSSSKQSKSSWESKKHHPRVANSAARLMFDMTAAKPSATQANLLPGVPYHPKSIYDDKLAPARYRDSSEGVSGRKDPVRPMSGFAALQTVKSNRNLPIKRKVEVSERNLQLFLGLVNSNPNFAIPDRPAGNSILLTLYTNWGDLEHLGLNGIEFFDSSGAKIHFAKPQESISATSSQSYSVHLSPEYLSRLIRPEVWKPNSDQLFISKLEDGNPLQIKIKFKDPQRLTFIRIWNYDKSKTHASRGVRHLSIMLGNQLIFFGEIKKSSGERGQFLEDAEYISFLHESNRSADSGFAADWVNTITEADYNPPHTDYNETYRTGDLTNFLRGNSMSREPSESIRGTVSSTSGSPRARGSIQGESRGSHPLGGWNALNMLDRRILHRNTASGYEFSLVPTLAAEEPSVSSPGHPNSTDHMEFTFIDAWHGAPNFALKAIELIDEGNNKIKVGKENIETDYDTIQGNVISLFSGDPIRKMEEYIWKASLNPQAKLKIKLSRRVRLKQVRLYTYSSKDPKIQGVKHFSLKIGTQAPLVKMVNYIPHEISTSYFQTFHVDKLSPVSSARRTVEDMRNPRTPLHPSDFVVPAGLLKCQMLRVKVLASVADKHFVGLNGLEVLDAAGQPLLYPPVTSFRVFADPTMASSGSFNEDKRVPENLVNGIIDGEDKNKFFMAPLINPKKWGILKVMGGEEHKAVAPDYTQILIVFDDPQEVSGLLLYNYNIDVNRCVSEIEVSVNENLVFIVDLGSYRVIWTRDSKLHSSHSVRRQPAAVLRAAAPAHL